MHDACYPLPRRHTAADRVWIAIDRDLLPLMRDSLQAARKAGFLQDSRDPAHYQLGGIKCGWDATGPLDVARQIRRLRLQAESG
jgi:hypothetical protein